MNTVIFSLMFAGLAVAPATIAPSDHDARRVTASVAPSDPPKRVAGQLQLAKEAAAAGRLDEAVAHVRSGLSVRATSRGVAYDKARLEAWAIGWRDDVVAASIAADRFDEARQRLRELSDPLTSAFSRERGAALLRRLEQAEQERARGSTRAVDPQRARMVRRMERSADAFARAERDLQRAEASSRRTVYSARRAQSALRRLVAIERDAEEWLREPDLDQQTIEELIALRNQVADGAMRALLRIASARTMQGDFREALDWVDRALARAPGDEDAKALRHTILLANAASAAWIGWGTAAAPGSSGAR